jgi:hypothetical protein
MHADDYQPKKTMINLSPDSQLQANSTPETFPTSVLE